jgi:hypothetical protein
MANEGGAVYISNTARNLTTDHCDYIGNQVNYGGANYCPTLYCNRRSQSLISRDNVVSSTGMYYTFCDYCSRGLFCSHVNISHCTLVSFASAFLTEDCVLNSFSRALITDYSSPYFTPNFYHTNMRADVSPSNFVTNSRTFSIGIAFTLPNKY